ncbi:MAG: hypothetical protein R3C29_03995 [Dehalococcoidia bacterium]
MPEADHEILDLHQGLLDGDPSAPAMVAERFLQDVITYLHRTFRTLHDPSLRDEASIDAILNYIEHPNQFQPAKGRLLPYLRQSARRDLLNKLDSIKRRARRELVREPVELDAFRRNKESEDAQDAASARRAELLEHDAMRVAKDATEEAVLNLMLDGVRETERYAEVLGLQSAALREQRRAVKRVKDRLTKRLERRDWGGE